MMTYNDFTLCLAQHTFGLTIINHRFCEDLPLAEPQPSMLEILNQGFPYTGIWRTEKVKSERLISPVLVEAGRLAGKGIQLFSGDDFYVDKELGLDGFCDFVFTRSGCQLLIDAPVIMFVGQPKEGILDDGWGKCVAQMVAAQIYNHDREKSVPIMYGCVTSGRLWQFLKLEGKNVTIVGEAYRR